MGNEEFLEPSLIDYGEVYIVETNIKIKEIGKLLMSFDIDSARTYLGSAGVQIGNAPLRTSPQLRTLKSTFQHP